MTLEERDYLNAEKGRDEKQCDIIRNMINNGFSVEIIAKAVGVTEEKLRIFCGQNGIELDT
ncbi:MAG: hypothetical protein ACFNYI_05790 [Eubacterium sp.]